MKTKLLTLLAILSFSQGTPAASHYVDHNSANPTPPYTNWATAATNLQDAVNVALTGDEVLVTNGTYRPIEVVGAIQVISVNGSASSIISGSGNGMISCVSLFSGAGLSGFTVTRGEGAGGVFCGSISEIVSNCFICGNEGDFGGGARGGTLISCVISNNIGGGVSDAILNDCVVCSNRGSEGGGVFNCTLNNCLVMGNTAAYGGGAWESTLSNCTLIGNCASNDVGGDGGGGGAWDSTLINCLVISNWASPYGGGAWGCFMTNCILTGNSAAVAGGGAFLGTLNNCLVASNLAEDTIASVGGGAASCTLNNCTLAFNSVNSQMNPSTLGGGGAWDSRLSNCILYFNAAPSNGPNYDATCLLNNCCTTPMPTAGFGNITNAPLFLDLAGGNLRLQSNSPCINAGNNAYAPPGPDLEGNPRIVGGTVDIGAYEFQNPASTISYAWLQQYGLPIDGSADFTDADGDGMNNWQEWRCGTDPTSALSALRLLSPTVTKTNVTVSWQSVTGVNYFLERGSNLTVSPAFTLLATNIVGQSGTTTYTDTNAASSGPFFYRVAVGN